jgi:hypothetical protein
MAFTIHTGIQGRNNTVFHQCFSQSWVLYGVSVAISFGTGFLSMWTRMIENRHSIIVWFGTFLLTSALVAIELYQITRIRAVFQQGSTPMSAESQYGFGQIMVFFMIFQLLVEFFVAVKQDFAKLHTNLHALQADIYDGSAVPRLTTFGRLFLKVVLLALPSKTLQVLASHRGQQPRRRRESRQSETSFDVLERPRRNDTISLESQMGIVQATGRERPGEQVELADVGGILSRRQTGALQENDSPSTTSAEDSLEILPIPPLSR